MLSLNPCVCLQVVGRPGRSGMLLRFEQGPLVLASNSWMELCVTPFPHTATHTHTHVVCGLEAFITYDCCMNVTPLTEKHISHMLQITSAFLF